jgi:hypothetical protein
MYAPDTMRALSGSSNDEASKLLRVHTDTQTGIHWIWCRGGGVGVNMAEKTLHVPALFTSAHTAAPQTGVWTEYNKLCVTLRDPLPESCVDIPLVAECVYLLEGEGGVCVPLWMCDAYAVSATCVELSPKMDAMIPVRILNQAWSSQPEHGIQTCIRPQLLRRLGVHGRENSTITMRAKHAVQLSTNAFRNKMLAACGASVGCGVDGGKGDYTVSITDPNAPWVHALQKRV